MGYERSDRPRGGDGDRSRGYGGFDERDREHRGRPSPGQEDRGFFDRAGDEVRSWFGDEEAERRRRYDERFGNPDDDRGSSRATGGERGYRRDDGPARWDSQTRHQTGAYGLGVQPDAGNGWSFRNGDDARNHHHDPHYRSWRDRQMETFDQDYAEFRRENQSRFETEFGTWRQTRERQRQSLGQVREHQEVIGSDGTHIGTVDKVKGDRILLTKTDQAAAGHHHSIPCSWIERVGDKVEISKTAEQAQAAWRDEDHDRDRDRDHDRDRERDPGAGQGEGDRSDGPHVLGRSFKGTY
ncbi:MAG: hypothetical protein JWM75_1537 [Sphingomonas bacterium]|nr:hypothetical protein [Sphingomonas bacterium]